MSIVYLIEAEKLKHLIAEIICFTYIVFNNCSDWYINISDKNHQIINFIFYFKHFYY